MVSRDRVLIAGGGIAGLAAAAALQLRSIPFVVYERRPDPPDGGLGLNLSCRSVRPAGFTRVPAMGPRGTALRADEALPWPAVPATAGREPYGARRTRIPVGHTLTSG